MPDPAQIQPWKVLDRKPLLSIEPWLNVYQEKVELPTGRIIPDFYRVVLPDFVAIVPVTAGGKFLLVRGYKHGVGRVILSPSAGLMHAGEAPLETAQRELREETGYEADDWQALGKFVIDGNRQCGTVHVFVARGAHPVATPEADETEVLQMEVLSRERVVQALRAGEIGNLAGAGSVSLALILAV
jgi:ADP-ribose pyrophosphatase